MDGNRFDAVARLLAAGRLSRRNALLCSAGVALAGALATRFDTVRAQDDATPVASPTAIDGEAAEDVMFVQGFGAGTTIPLQRREPA
jgi:hypothetical protein